MPETARNKSSLELTKELWRRADAVCFDVDSTVISGEAIDQLAHFCGRGEQVTQWTIKAMGGGVPFRKALDERLKIIRPTRQQLNAFMSQDTLRLTPYIRDVISTLMAKDTIVYLVSGGFKSLIEPIAEELNIPKENVFANRILFDNEGFYKGFDVNEPTSSSGGKAKVIQMLKQKHSYQRLVMVGDGATDMEACPPADAFIGFGGNVVRERVQKNASWFVTDFKTLLDELQ